MKHFTLVPAVLLATTVGIFAQSGLSKELESLQGTWVLTSSDGQSLEGSGQTVAVVITGDKYAQTQDGQVVERGTIKLDPSKSPIAIDLVITEGDDANKTQLGVLRIDGDTVTTKLSAPGATDRPTDFSPADGYLVLVAKKVKTIYRPLFPDR